MNQTNLQTLPGLQPGMETAVPVEALVFDPVVFEETVAQLEDLANTSPALLTELAGRAGYKASAATDRSNKIWVEK